MAESDPQKENEEQYELPDGWVWCKLGDVNETTSGGTPKRTNKDYYGGDIPWLKSGELEDNVITKAEETITELGLKKSSAKIFPTGTLLIALYGATVGKTGKLAIESATNQAICGIFNDDQVFYDHYLWHYLISFRNNLIEKSFGGAQPNISQGIIQTLKVPISPLNEQHRIVTKLETLLAQVNRSKDHLAKVPPLIKRFRQSVLAAACSGRLTEDWRREHPDVEPASELLNRIREERIRRYDEECQKAEAEGRRKPKKSKKSEPQAVDAGGLPELPDGWAWTKLKNLIEPSKEKAQPPFNKGEKYIGLEHIGSYKNRIIGMGEGTGVKSTKNRFHKGDLLYGKLRPYLNKTTVVDFDGVCSTDILVFPQTNFSENKYLMRFLSTQQVVSFANQNMEGIQLPRISFDRLSQLSITLPPISEQYIITERVETIFHFADEVEQRVSAATAHTNHLTHSILARAFRGELVPQDPRDEPASVLLERIKQERAKNEMEKKTGKGKTETLLDYC